MENEEWYYFDNKEHTYKIKDGAPEKTKKNYENYLRQQESMRERHLL